MDNETLATELIRELKAQSKRWFIIAVIELGLILAIVAAFFWYFSLPTDEISVEADSGNANYIGRDLEGDLYNGTSNTQEESSPQS